MHTNTPAGDTASTFVRGQLPDVAAQWRDVLVPTAPGRWRVSGDRLVAGHVEARATSAGLRFAALRFSTAHGRFRELGEFWSADDAIACVRSA